MDAETIMDESTIRENLRKAREGRGLTQADMADSLDISVTAYQKIESGKTRILNKNFSKCAEALGVSMTELVVGYVPVKDAAATLEDMRESFGMRLRVQENGYIQEIQERDREIARLKEIIKDKDVAIESQKLLIGQLMSRFKD
ncbi:MAG: helix-turn-helix transcriptional regulator [Bacteroidales bacterium]|nr:helix-turn-helix transcriptional regulator [Bacteroidales bacterium]MBQ6253662.1 helix-turn-helix transcriptional regulator [Bacteroidales bacterium]